MKERNDIKLKKEIMYRKRQGWVKAREGVCV